MTNESDNSREVHKMTIGSTAEEGQDAQERLLACMTRCQWDDRSVFGVKLALEEALVNAIKHGNDNDPTKKVHVCYDVSPNDVRIVIEDEGPGFDPKDVPDPTLPENLEKPSGRGLMLMRAYMTTVEFSGQGNTVTMTKVQDEEPDDQ